MLSTFFKLNTPFEEFDEVKLSDILRHSSDIRSILYSPDNWPPALRHTKSVNFTNVSLAKTIFRDVTFTKCVFEDCLFVGAQFSGVEFHRCRFVNCNFYKVEFEDCYIDPSSFSFDKKYRSTMANIGVHIYQQLFENSSKKRQSDFERVADFEFRKWLRWQLRYDYKSGKVGWWGWQRRRFFSFVYELVAGFGYRPTRFIIVTLCLFFIVSLLNMHLLSGVLNINGQPAKELSLSDGVFYTFSLMTALGFSTIVPTVGFAKLLAVMEALIGIGWLGVFTSLLVKRFIR